MSINQRSVLNKDHLSYITDRKTPFWDMIEERKNINRDAHYQLKISRKKMSQTEDLMTMYERDVKLQKEAEQRLAKRLTVAIDCEDSPTFVPHEDSDGSSSGKSEDILEKM